MVHLVWICKSLVKWRLQMAVWHQQLPGLQSQQHSFVYGSFCQRAQHPLRSLCSAKPRWRATRASIEVNDFYQSHSGATAYLQPAVCAPSSCWRLFLDPVPTLHHVSEKWRWPCHGNSPQATSCEIWNELLKKGWMQMNYYYLVSEKNWEKD